MPSLSVQTAGELKRFLATVPDGTRLFCAFDDKPLAVEADKFDGMEPVLMFYGSDNVERPEPRPEPLPPKAPPKPSLGNERCEMSELPASMCGLPCHRNSPELVVDHDEDTEDYEITAVFPAKFAGSCRVDSSHNIRKNDSIGRLQNAGNPMLPIQGYACTACVKSLPRART